jgi:hypothetical protein
VYLLFSAHEAVCGRIVVRSSCRRCNAFRSSEHILPSSGYIMPASARLLVFPKSPSLFTFSKLRRTAFDVLLPLCPKSTETLPMFLWSNVCKVFKSCEKVVHCLKAKSVAIPVYVRTGSGCGCIKSRFAGVEFTSLSSHTVTSLSRTEYAATSCLLCLSKSRVSQLHVHVGSTKK